MFKSQDRELACTLERRLHALSPGTQTIQSLADEIQEEIVLPAGKLYHAMQLSRTIYKLADASRLRACFKKIEWTSQESAHLPFGSVKLFDLTSRKPIDNPKRRQANDGGIAVTFYAVFKPGLLREETLGKPLACLTRPSAFLHLTRPLLKGSESRNDNSARNTSDNKVGQTANVLE